MGTSRSAGEVQGRKAIVRDVVEGSLVWKSLTFWIGLSLPAFENAADLGGLDCRARKKGRKKALL